MNHQITLRYFASIREELGVAQESWKTAAPTLGALRDELIARSAASAQALARSKLVRVARNQQLCDESAQLADGDEVAFFPPVTGG